MKPFLVINFIFFQVSWLLSANFTDEATAFLLLLLLSHFIISPSKLADLKVLAIAVIGCLVDQGLIYAQVINVGSTAIPAWLILLWCCFAVSLNHSFAWMQKLAVPYLVCIGAISGPASYYAALSLQAFDTSVATSYFLITFAIAWAVLLPMAVNFSRVSTMKMIKENKEASCV
ncbi:hypothetical protein PULV_b0868 [Pseudoalteromonas ulvae UL12]|uniref:DUF2878 domain-containing protein n=1 Tax=Pseudoalteromonas ulvae TaxID=107327 RepID=A0A244CRA0_PSEDV|nr:DUF2878 domain-containing protein [Pseudoalteromonas ulvae]MBE0366125.1 hypothetical protein [Pseudoalteromonas ulvae UL12]OUL58157.1 hypothetical protein B1199_07325 [Pseudoalteromonas ulvae]